jgi:hypothetical protein
MIEAVRGRLEPETEAEILAFWAENAALSDEEARRRLAEVVCILRQDGQVAGVSSAYPAQVPIIGGRRFWIYRNLLRSDLGDQFPDMVRATFYALEPEFDGAKGSPIGVCALIADAEERRRRPQVEWEDPRMIYAGYLEDGRQVRIAYFEGAEIA